MLSHCFSRFAFLHCSRFRPLNSNEFDSALYVALGMEIMSIPLLMHLAFVGTYVYGCILTPSRDTFCYLSSSNLLHSPQVMLAFSFVISLRSMMLKSLPGCRTPDDPQWAWCDMPNRVEFSWSECTKVFATWKAQSGGQETSFHPWRGLGFKDCNNLEKFGFGRVIQCP